MASEAEGRIRAKGERLLRDLFPDARIVHEIDLWGCRLDLAAITPDRLILAEIKSEKDTLSRLENQARMAASIGGPVLIMVAERWVEGFPYLGPRTINLVESGEGFVCFSGKTYRYPLTHHQTDARHDRYDSRRLMDLMLKPELFALARPHGAKSKHTVLELQAIAHEHLTGREIRRAVLAALRARRFGWTCDEPIGIAA